MNDPKYIAPETYRFPAIVELLPGYDPNHGVRCRLYHQDGCVNAWTWLSLDPIPNVLYWGWVSTMDIGSAYNDLLVLGLRENTDQPLSSLLPERLCPISGVVRQVSALIDGLRNKPLRRFMTRTLLSPPIPPINNPPDGGFFVPGMRPIKSRKARPRRRPASLRAPWHCGPGTARRAPAVRRSSARR